MWHSTEAAAGNNFLLTFLIHSSFPSLFYVKVKVNQSCATPCDPMGSPVHGILQARILEWVAFPFSRGSSQPRDQTQVSHIVGRFFTSWATGKPKNTGVGSLSLFQQIFLIQESNWGLLHCWWIFLPTKLWGKPPILLYFDSLEYMKV